MLRFLLLLITILTAVQIPAGGKLYAQHHAHPYPVEHPVFMSIEEAREAGELTRDESLLQKFYAGYRPSLLKEEFKSEALKGLIKCMVPAMEEFIRVKDRLLPETITEVENLLQTTKSSAEFNYISPSGNFVFYYDTTGTHAVPSGQTLPEAIEKDIPDYIYHAAFAADSSYRYQVEKLGFTDFILDSPYEIDFENFGFYGTTKSTGSTSFITVHSDFNHFPQNTHPDGNRIGALYVTIAHEIKHAIQYANNRWRGSAGSFNWIEMDATMMEEIVFDDVNDYYNYIRQNFNSDQPNPSSIFGNPGNPVPGAYWHITWMLYFAEEYGMDFWVDVWKEIRAEPELLFTDAIERQLTKRSEGFATNHLRNHLWHLGSGDPFFESDFGFREKEFYPEASVGFELVSVPDSLAGTRLRSLAAHYVKAAAPNNAIGQPNIRIESSAPGVGIGVIGIFHNGTSQKFFTVNPSLSRQQIQTPWNWAELTDLYIAIVNTNRTRITDYNLILDSLLPDEDILAQNYPNPFNPSTRIEFSLNNQKNVRIDVFDSIGRKVTTLLEDRLTKGFHFVDFDGSDLASGVYLYRIITDETVTTNKMMLIK